MILSLVTNLGVLAFFKYFNFFADSFVRFSSAVRAAPSIVTLQIILPMGISFYTFQALSYTIDVYRRELDTVHDPVRLLLVHPVFSSPRRRADRAGQDLLGAVHAAPGVQPGHRAGRASPDPLGVLHQGRDRRQPGRAS